MKFEIYTKNIKMTNGQQFKKYSVKLTNGEYAQVHFRREIKNIPESFFICDVENGKFNLARKVKDGKTYYHLWLTELTKIASEEEISKRYAEIQDNKEEEALKLLAI